MSYFVQSVPNQNEEKIEKINSEDREQNLIMYIQVDFYHAKLNCFTFDESPSINFSFLNSIL